MLVLQRRLGEEIVIGDLVRVRGQSIRGRRVQIGIEAPETIRILRGEISPHDRRSQESNGNAASPIAAH
jgi:carbon storage regulator